MKREPEPANRRLVASFFTREQEFQALQVADFRAAAARCHFEVEVLDAGDNPVIQIQQLFRIIHAPVEEHPLALIVQTRVPDGLERVARNAAGAGIGWVLLNRTAGYLEAIRPEIMSRTRIEKVFPGRHMTIGRVAHLTESINGRGTCQFRNRCGRGCPYGAYFSSNAVFVEPCGDNDSAPPIM